MFPHCTVCPQLHWDYDHRQRQPSLRKYQDHNKHNNCLTPIPHANDIHYIIIIMTMTATPTYDRKSWNHSYKISTTIPTLFFVHNKLCRAPRQNEYPHCFRVEKTQTFILRSMCSSLRIFQVALFYIFPLSRILLTIPIATNARDNFVFSSSFLYES